MKIIKRFPKINLKSYNKSDAINYFDMSNNIKDKRIISKIEKYTNKIKDYLYSQGYSVYEVAFMNIDELIDLYNKKRGMM